MGNTQVNVTITPSNGTGNGTSNYSYPSGGLEDLMPPFRPPLSLDKVYMHLKAVACICAFTFVINLLMVIFTSVKLRAVPYMFIQNFMVVDIINAVVTTGPWCAGILLDFFGLGIVGIVCRIQGFFHNTLNTVMLGNVSAIAISRFLYVVSPSAYSMFFVNKPVVRLLLFTIWFGSGFLASPPLNHGTWGAYDKLEGTCWMSWKKGDTAAVSYAGFHTILTLGPALVSTILAIVFVVLKKKNAIHPTTQASSAQLNTSGPHPPATPSMMGSTRGKTHFLNLEVLYISCAVFLLYLVLWTTITVVESLIIIDWRKVDFQTVIVLIFIYQSRGLMHPFIYLLLSREMRHAFIKCGKGRAGLSLSVDNERAPSVAAIPVSSNIPEK